MSNPAVLPADTQTALFDLWAKVYDDQNNPLLRLAERHVKPLLPALAGLTIVDAGCGTGRWLQHCEHSGAAAVIGIDSSPAMLERAANSLSAAARLHLGVCSSIPVENGSCDLLLSSFVLSYLDDLAAFAHECARLLKPGGSVLLADMHPATSAERGWKRSFPVGTTTVQLAAQAHSLAKIISVFEGMGFALTDLQEPAFGPPERTIFEAAGKLAEYQNLDGVPAIYVLKLRKRDRLQLSNAVWSMDAQTWTNAPLMIEDERVVACEQTSAVHTSLLDLRGYAVLPGLINAHDHLEFALFPNLGREANEPPYRNATEWAYEIHHQHADVIAQHLRVPLKTRLWWGALRNLCCGVTTVCHHNPNYPELTDPDFPVRVLSNFGWAHSLAFDANLAERFQATPSGTPFIVHAAEGTDEQSRSEFSELERLRVLDQRTVLVHALALGAQEISRLNEAGASVILCPTSNDFLFARTLPAHLLHRIEHVALGSDSPLTAAGDLLDEIQFLHSDLAITADTLYKLVTSNAAHVLHLQRGEGTIAAGGIADLIAVPGTQASPAQTIAALTLADVELVLLAGRVQLASTTAYERLPPSLRAGLHLLSIAGHLRWVRAPLPSLFADAECYLGTGALRLGGKEVSLVELD